MKYEAYYKDLLEATEKTLDQWMPPSIRLPHPIHAAMRYAVFPSGKRFRPVLTLAACEALGGRTEDALLPAAAVELIHCYSLAHDDLPALDNDEMRRGRLTCHRKYGEAAAILAGDGLLTLAFHILSKVQPAKRGQELLEELSTAAGTYGMIGGQVADLMTAEKDLNLPMLDFINIHKTGKLIKASAVCGAIAAGASRDERNRMLRYGECLGLAFQSIDDLLDGDGYLKFIKAAEVRQKARDLIAQSMREIRPLGKKSERLQRLADYLLKRIPRENRNVAVDR